MPATHSNLHFVNLSTPTEGKDEETRKAVRTHVMQHYIQKKRLRETRKVAKKPASERVPKLCCTCPYAFSTSNSGSASSPSVCPTCHGRPWAVEEPALDESGGRHFSNQQAVTRFTSHRRRHTVHPATLLGAGRVDPFGIYPVETQPYMHDLLDHYFVLLSHALVPADITGQQSPLLTKWMKLALRCPALFHGTLLVSSTHYAASRKDPRDETSVFIHRSQAVLALNDALADPEQATSDDNIAAVINLAGHELLEGNLSFYTCHMIGLEKMIGMRGGLHTLGLDGLTEALVHWVDQMGVVLTGSEPRFPPVAIPTLVPQAQLSASSLPSPTSISSLDAASEIVFEGDIPNVNSLGEASTDIASGFTFQKHQPSHTTIEIISGHPSSSTLSPTVQPAQRTDPSQPFDPSFSSTPLATRAGRDEAMDMMEVGRFATIVYPKRRWKGFARYGGNNDHHDRRE